MNFRNILFPLRNIFTVRNGGMPLGILEGVLRSLFYAIIEKCVAPNVTMANHST